VCDDPACVRTEMLNRHGTSTLQSLRLAFAGGCGHFTVNWLV
jgi:hypothetical protein